MINDLFRLIQSLIHKLLSQVHKIFTNSIITRLPCFFTFRKFFRAKLTTNVKICNNNFDKNGIYFFNNELSHWNTHVIENNYVNEKPIYYYKNHNDSITIPSDAGQVIVANCSQINLKNINFNNLYSSIQIAYSSNITINNNNPPVADAGPDQNVSSFQNVYFNGSGSYDPDNDPLYYRWDFGDGHVTLEQ